MCYTIVRPFNVYGPGELPGIHPGNSHVIPDLVNKLLVGQYPLEIFGDGLQTRSFTHVRDVARGVVLALESSAAVNEDFNLGVEREITILELARLLWDICSISKPFAVTHLEAFPHDIRRRGVNISKARKLLQWQPELSLESGLAEVVDWLRTRLVVNELSQ